MNQDQWARRHNQSAVGPTRERRDRVLDLVGVAHADRAQLDPKRRRGRLHGAELASPGSNGAISKYPHPRHARRDLFEQLQPFAAHGVFKRAKSGNLPPGRVRLSTKPAPTGSGTWANTIGTVLVASNNAPVLTLPLASMTSGASATSSAAYLRALSAVPCATRWAIRTLSPSRHPNFWNACRNAAMRLRSSGSFSAKFVSIPIRRIRSGCCARAAIGHAAAAPPSSVMNSRRFIRSPRRRGRAALPALQVRASWRS